MKERSGNPGQRGRGHPVFGRAFRAGIAGWTAVACVWAGDVAFQLHGAGQPAWWALPNTLLAIAPGAALTPAVFLAFRRLLARPRPLPGRVLLYAAIGVAYWLLWSLVEFALTVAGMFRTPARDVSHATLLFQSVAGFSFNSLLLYTVMAMLHEAVRHVREARRQELRTSRLQAELARARTAALRAQLNPHFLFNTLHVASGLTGRDTDGARAVLRDLGELLRGSLAEGGAQLVPLDEELRLVERYAGIQKARFGDRLHVEFRIDAGTRVLGVPPLLLQPLVENAVIHGVAQCEEGGRIDVIATAAGERLRLAVVDSGPGMPTGGTTPPHERVGIGATRARLRLLFGDDATLRFSCPTGGGCRAEIEFPAARVPAATTRRGEPAASAAAAAEPA